MPDTSLLPPHTYPSILPLESAQATLARVGGKGANLARLAQAGFPVPGGFLITVQGYQDFVAANHLEPVILAALPARPDYPAALEAASAAIRGQFAAGVLPEDLKHVILDAYTQLAGAPLDLPVAVRSSATAEDLPEMSFAGQQDTYLNVVGPAQLFKAVVDCWSSLWTARAIGYRARNGVPHTGAALAVVVQKMVPSRSSGVLFTANPLTGLRSETVIDATFGLGEALVSGQVEPDHYVVADSPAGLRIQARTLGSKKVSIHGQAGGGTLTRSEDSPNQPALPDQAILALAGLGQQVARLYRVPQDIEWAWAGESLYLLQSRPITSLFPLPVGVPPEPLRVWMSFAAVQGMMDPVTPLGRDVLGVVFAAGAGIFGIKVTSRTQRVLFTAGERLWLNFSTLVYNSVGRQVIPVVLSMVEPTVKQALAALLDDPRLQPGRKGISLHALRQISRFFLPVGFNMFRNIISPNRRRAAILNDGEQLLHDIQARCAALTGDRQARLAQVVAILPSIAANSLPQGSKFPQGSTFPHGVTFPQGSTFAHMLILFVSGVASGIATFNFFNVLASHLPQNGLAHTDAGWHDQVLEITRGMPYNPTTEMDLALWQVAKTIRHDPASSAAFEGTPAGELANSYPAGDLPPAAQSAIRQFLFEYGGRGLAEIDLGRPRWAEDPTPIFEMLGTYLQIDDESQAPDAVFGRGALAAQQAIDQVVAALRKTPGGWFKARLARFFASRARALMGMRESPKFFAVRLFSVLRNELLKIEAEYTQAGELQHAGDLFYLTLDELASFAAGQPAAEEPAAREPAAVEPATPRLDGSALAGWRALIAQRRENYRRELLRRQIPRLLLSDGRAFYEGMADSAGDSGPREPGTLGTLTGSPVSPGRVVGRVRVVLDPRQAGLLPGEIMVCPGTDPSWTPLFLSAGGLILETGGMMTHGAVVAREYGIPAVVGVGQATTRLQTGQRVRLNGSTGIVTLLDDQADK